MSYAHATVPPDTNSELPGAHQPGEPAAATLARAIVAHLAEKVWVPDLGWESNGVTATARLTVAAAGTRIPVMLSWRAGQFTLVIDGRRDPLRHGGLAHRAEHLATLVADTTAVTAEQLAEQHVAERLAATIAYAGTFAACERTGAELDLLTYQCAQCGDVDFTAAAGGPTHLASHRCPVCRGVVAPAAPAAPALVWRPRPRHRPRSVQQELLDAQALPVSQAQQHYGPLADWPPHRLLQQITQGRFTVWRENVYEVVEGHRHHTIPPDPDDTALIGRLRRAGLVRVGLWFFADVDGQSRETHLLDLTRDGWRVFRRWTLLHSRPTG